MFTAWPQPRVRSQPSSGSELRSLDWTGATAQAAPSPRHVLGILFNFPSNHMSESSLSPLRKPSSKPIYARDKLSTINLSVTEASNVIGFVWY